MLSMKSLLFKIGILVTIALNLGSHFLHTFSLWVLGYVMLSYLFTEQASLVRDVMIHKIVLNEGSLLRVD